MKPYGKTLRELRERAGYGQGQVASYLQGRGYDVTNTHVSRWENGYNNPTVEQFIELCALYGVRDVYKVFAVDGASAAERSLNRAGMEQLSAYGTLLTACGWFSGDGAQTGAGPEPMEDPADAPELMNASEDRSGRAAYAARDPLSSESVFEHQPAREIPSYTVGQAGGTRNTFEELAADMIPLAASAPQHADFAVQIETNSMAPMFGLGDLVYARRQNRLRNGDVGVVSLNGDAYVKVYEAGIGQAPRLISANPAFAPISVGKQDEFVVYGKVISPEIDPKEINRLPDVKYPLLGST